MNNYYIYIYLDPRKLGRYCYNDICFLFEPFYIGKGKDKRYKDINENRRNKYFIRKINKIKKSGLEPIIFKLNKNLNEQESFEFERQLIKEIGRIDLGTGPLVNMTDGGDGVSNRIISEKYKIKISERMMGKNNPMFDKPGTNLGKKFSEESKKKLSTTRKEKFKNGELINPFFGKKHSEESRKKMKQHVNIHCGENHYHKLTNIKVIQINMLFKLGFKNIEIAKLYSVDESVISRIKNKKTWKYVQF